MAKGRKKIKDELLQSVVDKITSSDKPKIETYIPCEWVIQFDNNEPIVFATGPNECHIRLAPSPEGNMTFTDSNNNSFKLFAREINDA